MDVEEVAAALDKVQDYEVEHLLPPVPAAALIAAEDVIEAYTRGRHARAGAYRPGVRSVVLTAAARILANPGQVSVRVSSGAVTISKGAGWQGFTLGEQQVLNRYRKRAI